jgi:hypothetical protein
MHSFTTAALMRPCASSEVLFAVGIVNDAMRGGVPDSQDPVAACGVSGAPVMEHPQSNWVTLI